MNPRTLDAKLYETEKMARLAMPYIPRRSKYFSWCLQLFAGDIEVVKYVKLQERLIKFHSQV